MISFDLKDRAALVTGAASGIGLETARMLARSGARVAVNYLPGDERGPQAVQSILDEGGFAVGAPGDVGEVASVEAMVNQAVSELGRLDLLVNNAGAPGVSKAIPVGDLDSITEELWSFMLNTNLMSVFRCSKVAAPALVAAGGAIVNTASIAGFGSVASTLCYSAAKAGVINLTKNLSRALAPQVRVNAVAPGVVDSSWGIGWTDDHKTESIAKTPLKRWATPADVAELIVYLGFGARMITGQTVVIDGGISL